MVYSASCYSNDYMLIFTFNIVTFSNRFWSTSCRDITLMNDLYYNLSCISRQETIVTTKIFWLLVHLTLVLAFSKMVLTHFFLNVIIVVILSFTSIIFFILWETPNKFKRIYFANTGHKCFLKMNFHEHQAFAEYFLI